jgi:hypothetical protein
MNTYKVPCIWQMTGYYIVEANSIEEAKEKTYSLPLSDAMEVEYLDGSHQPDIDESIEIIKD